MKELQDDFKKCYEQYYETVFRYVYKEVKNRQMAEDITQETFCTAYLKWDDLEENASRQRWLICTAKNKLKEAERRMRRWPELVDEDDVLEVQAPEEDYGLKELELTALATMKPEEWNLFKSYYLEGYSAEELADDVGISDNNMRVRLCRLKNKLRRGLGR